MIEEKPASKAALAPSSYHDLNVKLLGTVIPKESTIADTIADTV